MVDSLGLVAIGVGAFAATNIDDIFVLMLFFSSLSFSSSSHNIRSISRNWFTNSHQRSRVLNLTSSSILYCWINGHSTYSNRYQEPNRNKKE